MYNPVIPLTLAHELRCLNCEKFINCGPVHVLPNGSETNMICGRCASMSKPIYRNISYEALASMFLHPCCNWEKYCSTMLKWNESIDHEWECPYGGCCSRFWRHPTFCCSGKRELPLGGDIRHIAVDENLLEHLECVLCQKYLSCDPVYLQSNGKNICHRCSYSNGIPNNCIRNRTYETLSCIVVFPCTYRRWGCPTRLKFGSDLWDHEVNCPYGVSPMSSARISKELQQQIQEPISHHDHPADQPTTTTTHQQKERGVIQTHSGHYYGTITPMNMPFAPPRNERSSDMDVNKELVKSMKRREERKFTRAEYIGNQLDRMNGEVSDDNFDRYDEQSSSGRSEESYQPNRNKPQKRDSGYSTPSNNKIPTVAAITPIHHHHQAPSQQQLFQPQLPINLSRSNSFQYPTTAVGANDPRINQPRSSFLKNNHTPSPEPPFTMRPPTMMNDEILSPSNLARSESMNSNKDFLMELKRKQERIKHGGSISEANDNYRY